MSLLKVLLAIGIIALIGVGYTLSTGVPFYQTVFENFPQIKSAYNYLVDVTITGSIEGVFIYTFLAATPLVPIPIEPYWFYVLSKGFSPALLIGVASLAATLGGLVGYTIGYFIPIERIYEFFGKTYTGTMDSWPSWILPVIVFITSALPFPDIISFVYGSYRIPLGRYVIFHLLGTAFRVTMVIILLNNFDVAIGYFGKIGALI